ncbi:MAG: hypothetical protein NT005_02885 [Spirochaetes bacterium]|nr:hypothetical protein [Spirochaetota bacterium]
MKITIDVPTKAEILRWSKTTPVAGDEEPWSKDCLGKFANLSGVYIHCTGRTILYVGKTTRGSYGTFGERLRRECQKKASHNSPLYGLLRDQKLVKTAFIPVDDIEARITPKGISTEDLALLFERALIAANRPIGNRDSKR